MLFSEFPVTENDSGRRLDRIVRRFLPAVPLSALYKYIRKGLIRLDDKKCSADSEAFAGMRISIAEFLLSDAKTGEDNFSIEGEVQTVVPVIICETKDLIVFNKPSGIPVHGEGGLDRIIKQSSDAAGSLSFRSGPLHRLDRDTSGLLVFSRTLAGAQWFSSHIADHSIRKTYIGIVCGVMKEDAVWHSITADGKEMITEASPIFSRNGGYSLVQYRILTGRKHQIRIQSAEAGYPLYGDSSYGKKLQGQTFSLHAWELKFPSDRPQGLPEVLTAELPGAFVLRIENLFGKNALAQKENGVLYWKQDEELQ